MSIKSFDPDYSTSFIAPKEKKIKLSYLLFLPGWILLGTSIYFGNKVERGYLAALHLAESSGRYEVAVRMNNSYKLQQNLLMFGMGIFGVWLIVYLFWWVFKRN